MAAETAAFEQPRPKDTPASAEGELLAQREAVEDRGGGQRPPEPMAELPVDSELQGAVLEPAAVRPEPLPIAEPVEPLVEPRTRETPAALAPNGEPKEPPEPASGEADAPDSGIPEPRKPGLLDRLRSAGRPSEVPSE
jgi:hypothetical protein